VSAGGAAAGGILHVFDMDGTLLRGASTLELARHFGKPEVGEAIESRWLRGDITDREFWETLLAICGPATEAEIDAAFDGAPWMDGIAEVFEDIRARGETAIVVSQSPAFYVRRLQRWGAHETYGSDVRIGSPVLDDVTMSAHGKVEITKATLARLGQGPEACIAYGDGTSDLELFDWLPHTVAVNSSPVIAELAAAGYVGTDMREAYRLGRELLSADPSEGTRSRSTS
jgi:phosphoserine phosphatase